MQFNSKRIAYEDKGKQRSKLQMKKVFYALAFLVLSAQALGDLLVVSENAESNMSPISNGQLICDTGSNITWFDRSVAFNTWDIMRGIIDDLEVIYESDRYTDWRLPTCEEMSRLFWEEFGDASSIEEHFDSLSAAGAIYWSSSLNQDGDQACSYNFQSGVSNYWGVGQWASGMPVRSGCIEPPVITSPAIVLLFDGSGSMSWSYEGDQSVPEEQQRLFLVKEAVKPFMDHLLEFREDQVQFGISRFPYDPYNGCTAEALYGMRSITQQSHETAVNEYMSTLVPTGDTPMIAGLERATDMLSGIDRKAVVLLSDGYHNCPPVEYGDTTYNALITRLQDEGVRVYTIGFSRPGDVDGHFLAGLADDTEGYFHDVTDDLGFPESWDPQTALAPEGWTPQTAVTKAYHDILVQGLGLESIVDPHGVIRAGETLVRKVPISEHEQKVSFFLSWSTPEKTKLGLTVKSSDQKSVELSPHPGINIYEGRTYKIITVDNAFLQEPGKVGRTPWVIEINADGMRAGEQENYQYSVSADSALKMLVTFDKSHYETGDIVTISARFVPKTHSLASKVKTMRLEVTRPIDGVGNWLAANSVSDRQLSKIAADTTHEKLVPMQREIRFLKESQKVQFPGRTAPVRLDLVDDGTHGDNRAGDGIYTNQFSDTVKEGTYSFRVRTNGSTKPGNVFQREVMFQKYITVNVSPNHVVVVAADAADVAKKYKRYVLTITPKDALGNYLGPNHSSVIKMKASKGAFVDRLKDNRDGTYSQVIELPRTQDVKDADISINVSGKELSFNLGKKVAK